MNVITVHASGLRDRISQVIYSRVLFAKNKEKCDGRRIVNGTVFA